MTMGHGQMQVLAEMTVAGESQQQHQQQLLLQGAAACACVDRVEAWHPSAAAAAVLPFVGSGWLRAGVRLQ